MSEVRYSKASLPECCRRLSGRLEEPYKGAFEEVCFYMEENTGEEFGQIFCKRMEACFAQLPLRKEEKEIFLQFASGSGFEDGKMQVRSMEQYRDMLQDITVRMEQESGEQSRMALGLGAMGGLLLVIILL